MCCLDFSLFPCFKKNYPFYPILILKNILFSYVFWEICLKLGQVLKLSKDRKRIKTSERWEDIVGLVNSHYIIIFEATNCILLATSKNRGKLVKNGKKLHSDIKQDK